MVITPTTLTITQLLGSTNEQYVIPAYQRRYSWRHAQVAALWDDIDAVTGTDTHLLGTIVCLAGHHKAGINCLELVDGQQRLTTISIILHCFLERMQMEEEEEAARDLERLLSCKAFGGRANPKIDLDSLDSRQFGRHISSEEISDPENQHLLSAFGWIREWIKELNLTALGEFLYKLMNQAFVIRLDVSEAKDAFKLFETINNRGLKLSPTDIIKNFILGNAARFGSKDLQHAQDRWRDLLKHLDGICTDTFFRQYLICIRQTKVTRRMLVGEFKDYFMNGVKEAEGLPDHYRYDDQDDDDEDETDSEDGDNGEDEESNGTKRVLAKVPFRRFLKQLVDGAGFYREIFSAQMGKPAIDRRLRNLKLIKSMQSHGFLMALRLQGCDDSKFEQVLALTEAFILRRHVCREPSNQTEQLFAKLCAIDAKNPVPELRRELQELCPSNEDFEKEFTAASFKGALMDRARYCLEQFELHQQGRYVELVPVGSDSVHIEHIIPQKIQGRWAKNEFGDWPTYLGPNANAKHGKYLWRIGNLTLFAGPLNIGASNNPYARKAAAYKQSAFKITKSLPVKYSTFRFAQVDKRSAELAKLAVKIWPLP